MRVGYLPLLAVLLLLPGVAAQDEPERFLYDFSFENLSDPFPPQDPNEPVTVEFTITDLSVDDATIAGGGPVGFFPHRIVLEAEIVDGDDRGWQVTTMPNFVTVSGQTVTGSFQVRPMLTVNEPQMRLLVTATLSDDRSGIEVNRSMSYSFLTPGQQVFSAQPRGVLDLAPGQAASMSVVINHGGLLPRTFDAEVIDNPCNVRIVAIPTTTVTDKGRMEIPFSVQAPEDKLLYLNEDCSVTMGVYAVDSPSRVVTVQLQIVVNGNYIDPAWAFTAAAIAVAVFFLILIVLRRKAVIEEELLGKPQRPWTIPVERVYLEHLEARDARAAYVVRHFLMEEEYRSALLWYKSFKSATKGTRAKETLVVRQEKSYGRFQKKWAKLIARPIKKSDRYAQRLQKKLDRQAKAGVRKDRRTWKKKVAKLEEKHEKRGAKLIADWEKSVKKAEKRGDPVPSKPTVGAPELPAKPELQKVLLADHKWQKKADRMQRKMIKKQGNLEVRFEKKDARRLIKVRRKVHKIARKIDDPDFANEHPLIADA